ncbi:MFS transporter [Chloroflexota bacterium]
MNDSNRQLPHRVFYGWWIVAACFLISAYFSGVVGSGFTAFFEPIATDLGWSYAQVSIAASIRGFEAGLLAPLLGFLIDRYGARRLIFIGTATAGLGLLLLSQTNSPLMFYGAFILVTVGFSTNMGVVPMTVVGHWFRKRVSTATGILVSGVAFGGLLVPLVTRVIDVLDWRAALVVFGLAALIIILPLSLLVRQKPEQYGYLPDGDVRVRPVSSQALTPAPSDEINIGVRQATKSGAFWHISLGLMCNFLVITATITHIMPYLSTIGIARSTSSLVASALPVTSILGRLSFGWLGDRFDKRRVMACSFILVSLSMLLLNYTANVGTWLLVPFIVLFGIGWGGMVPMTPALPREYFGRASLGPILGFTMGIARLGTMAGPPLAGWAFDTWGSYQGVWLVFAGVAIAGMVTLLTTPPVVNTIQMANK